VGAAGRALLCGLTLDEVSEYFVSAASGAGRLAKLLDIETFFEELAEVRSKGYAYVSGEMSMDSWAIAAPVRDHTGEVVAALTISAPSDRLTPGHEAACIANAVEGAGELSLQLGFTPPTRTPIPR
jgi:DNA-binding IclR family transcriptional regulator